ncbi:hypothetical protein CYMTET_53890 [Cymbomonas tetramitiformis]|uniref:Ferredoxin thioredoxin reductase alpha chain domain-containing protein n=1 Tax=Cymbomonas tetramitiformis TaxID=36881 RepID=A0AAE0BHW2_9CHLO|nr:hypothetical protein CYMTET_53890 [Cymbomonas tetramitiformis]
MAAVEAGTRVKVTAPITVFHVPKTKGAPTLLTGCEGEVVKKIDESISAVQPFQVRVEVETEAGPVKVLAHFAEEEIEEA